MDGDLPGNTGFSHHPHGLPNGLPWNPPSRSRREKARDGALQLQQYQMADEIARGGAAGAPPHPVIPNGGVQVHFSYVTRKADEIICKAYLSNVIRCMYNINMVDLLIKKQVHDEKRKVQSGYGFVFFDNLEDAQLLVKNFKGLTLNGVSYDCSISHRSESQLNSSSSHSSTAYSQPRHQPATPSLPYSSAHPATTPTYMPGAAPYSSPVFVDYNSSSPGLVAESPSLYSPVSRGYVSPAMSIPSAAPNPSPTHYPPTSSPFGYAPMGYAPPRYPPMNSQYNPYPLPYPTPSQSLPLPPSSVVLMPQRSPENFHGGSLPTPPYPGSTFLPNPMLRGAEGAYAPHPGAARRQMQPPSNYGPASTNNPYPPFP